MEHSRSCQGLRPPRLKDCCKTGPHCQYCPHAVCYTRTRCNPDRKQCHQFPAPHRCVAGCQPAAEERVLSASRPPSEHAPEALREEVPLPQDPEQRLRELLVTHNRAYFEERGKLCCKKKPRKNKLDLLATMPGKTIYKKDFVNKGEPDRLAVAQWPDYKSNLPFQQNTEYLNEYPEKTLPEKPPCKAKPAREDKPMFGMSHYKHNYPKWGLQPNDNFKPIDPSTVLKGMNIAKDTIYKKDFDRKHVQPEPLRKQPQRPPMSGFDIPMTTHYRNNFLPWKPQVTETMKPVERPGKYLRPTQMSTEYTDHFIGEPNELNQCHYKMIEGFDRVINAPPKATP